MGLSVVSLKLRMKYPQMDRGLGHPLTVIRRDLFLFFRLFW